MLCSAYPTPTFSEWKGRGSGGGEEGAASLVEEIMLVLICWYLPYYFSIFPLTKYFCLFLQIDRIN